MRGTLIGWNRSGVVDAAALGQMLSRLAQERRALLAEPAPAPAPAPAPTRVAPVPVARPAAPAPEPVPQVLPVPWPVPRAEEARPEAGRRSIDGWLRQSAGWLVGAALTVVGSVYLAGTLWDGLSAGWRTTITLLFLAAWSVGFGAVGRRLLARGFGAGAWLIGVGAALAPVHALAAGSLWPHPGAAIALAVVALVQGRALWRAAADLAPGAGLRLWVPWLALSLGAGLVPLHVGLELPTLLLCFAVWGLGVRGGGPVVSVAVLLGFSWLLHPLLGGSRPLVALSLPLAGLAALALYVDLAWARWRGLWRVGLEGWRGMIVGALALAALGCTIPSFAPLPSGIPVLATWATVALVALAAAVAWRRPGLVGVTLLACLGFALTLPSLSRPLFELVGEQASLGLGYGGEPLPIAWRALTLVPWLGLWLWLARRLPDTGWRQSAALQEQVRRWSYGIALALLALAPTLPGDPRPFLLVVPIYAVSGLFRPKIRVSEPLALAIAWVPIVAGTVWFSLLGPWLGAPSWLAQVLVTAWLGGVVVAWADRRIALLGWPLAASLLLLGAPGPALVGAGVVGLLALVSAREEDRPVLAGIAPGLLLVGAALTGLAHGVAPWALLGAVAVLAGLASWLRFADLPGERTVLAWAAAAVLTAGVAGLGLADPGRIVLRLALGAVLLGWTRERRDEKIGGVALAPLFGIALALGIAESVWRRLGLAGLEPQHAIAGAALALGLWSRVYGRAWIVDGVATPARWVGALVVGIGVLEALHAGVPTLLAAAGLLPLVLAAWLLGRRGSEAPAWVAIALGVASQSTAVPAGLALGFALVPGPGLVAAGVAALHGAWHGPTGAGWVGLAAAAVVLGAAARRIEVLRAPALVGLGLVAALALQGLVGPPIGVYPLLAALAGIGLVLGSRIAPWRTECAVTGHWLVLATVLPIAGLVPLPGQAGPLEVAAGLLVAGYAVSVREAWVARLAAGLALAAGLLWAGVPAAVWVLSGTAALAAHHLAVTFERTDGRISLGPIADRNVAWLQLALVAGLIPPLLGCTGSPWPVAPCWPLLAGVTGASLVALGAPLRRGWLLPLGLTLGLVQGSVPMGGSGAWGLVLAAAALGVVGARPVPALLLALGAAGLVGTAVGLPGLPVVALLLGVAVAVRWLRPETALDAALGAIVTAAAAVWVTWALATAELVGWTVPGPVAATAAVLVGVAAMAVPGWARQVLGLVGALLLAVSFGMVTGVGHDLSLPLVLAAIAGAAGLWNRSGRGARRDDVDLLLALACVAPLPGALGSLSGFWSELDVATLELGAVTLAALLVGRREVAAAAASLGLLCAVQLGIPQPEVASLAVVLGMAWAVRPVAPITSGVLRVALPVLGTLLVLDGIGPLGWLVWTLGVGAELALASRRPEPAAVWPALVSGGLMLGVARSAGPLASIPLDLVVPAAVGFSVVLEAAGMALAAHRGPAFAGPFRRAAVVLVASALVYSGLLGLPTAVGLGVAGAWFCGRHVLRGGVPDLLIGALLLDAGAVLLAAQAGLSDPLPYVAPFSLSALVLAQRLRGTLQREAVTLIRYVAAGALYVTCFGQGLFDPVYTAVLVLLALVGIAAGELLRVRSFLHLGMGSLAAALGWNLLRFGFAHAGFLALYLTGLGVLVLGGMVLLTLHRDAVLRIRQRLLAHVASWEL